METSEQCIVCGGQKFKPAYGGRVSANGKAPTCTQCGSVERHRIIFQIYQKLISVTKGFDALQFAPDCSMQKDNFKSFTGSVYGGENSLDIKNTKLADGKFDIIISNHVFEHIDDDIAALKECLRVVGETGIVHICVPAPAYWSHTDDWGYPDKDRAYHYRHYGGDMGANFCKQVGELSCIAVVGKDSVTEVNDVVFFFSTSQKHLSKFVAPLQASSFVCITIS